MSNFQVPGRSEILTEAPAYNQPVAEIATPVELDGQYRALREEAGYLPRELAALIVRGPDAAEYLQGQLTNDIEALEREAGCYTALLDRKGPLQADMRLPSLVERGLSV